MKDQKSQYQELLRTYFKQQEEAEFIKEWTFQPKINQSSQCRMYFYQSSEDATGLKHKADVIKRNELWKESKNKKLESLKREQEMQINEQCTFTPKMNSGKYVIM